MGSAFLEPIEPVIMRNKDGSIRTVIIPQRSNSKEIVRKNADDDETLLAAALGYGMAISIISGDD